MDQLNKTGSFEAWWASYWDGGSGTAVMNKEVAKAGWDAASDKLLNDPALDMDQIATRLGSSR